MKGLIKRNETLWVMGFDYTYIEGIGHYRNSFVREFYSVAEFWDDGVKFYIGTFDEGTLPTQMLEASTSAVASQSEDLGKKKPTPENFVLAYKDKLANSGKTIGEIIQRFERNKMDMELWAVSCLIS